MATIPFWVATFSLLVATNLINTYLLRKNRKLVHCVYIPLRNEGMEILHELCHEEETEKDRAKLKRIRMVIVNIRVRWLK
jgi:hypothetical protein